MTTLQGALVRVESVDRFREVAARFRVTVRDDASGPWLLIDVAPRLGKLGPPPFAQALSSELKTGVIAFFVQSVVSNERVEHWESGRLVRELEYYLDGGGWTAQAGEPQPWEGAYFFSDDEGTRPDDDWPSNLSDEISDEDIRRYEAARAKRAPGPVMDLLNGGDIGRLCESLGVDLGKPGAHFKAPPNWRVPVFAFLIFALLVGAAVLGWITR